MTDIDDKVRKAHQVKHHLEKTIEILEKANFTPKQLLESLYSCILDELALDICQDVYRLKNVPVDTSMSRTKSNTETGDKKSKNSVNEKPFQCRHCSRPIHPSKFAPHLEKCMGKGRFAARVARQRVRTPANYVDTPGDTLGDAIEELKDVEDTDGEFVPSKPGSDAADEITGGKRKRNQL